MKDGLVLSGIVILVVMVYQYFLSNGRGDEERSLRRRLDDEDSWYNKNVEEEEQSEEEPGIVLNTQEAPVIPIQAYPTRTPTCGHSLDCFLYYWESQRDFAKSGYSDWYEFALSYYHGVYLWGDEDSPLFTPKMPGKTVEYPSNEAAEELGRKDFIEGRGFCSLPELMCFNPVCKACRQTKDHRDMFLKYYSHGYNSARKAVEM